MDRSAIRHRKRSAKAGIALALLLTMCCAMVLGACDDTGGVQFTLPTYAQHVGVKGDGKDGYYGASEGLAYTLALDSQTYTVTGIGNCTDADVIIPDTYNGKPVVGIESGAFKNCKQIMSVIVGNNITVIGNGAFAECGRLLSVTLGLNLTTIEHYAFVNCFRLLEVHNRSTLTIQCGSPEYGLVGFFAKNIYTDEEGSTRLFVSDQYVLYRDDAITSLVGSTSHSSSLTVPEIATEVGDYAFADDTALQNVIIPSHVVRIGRCAFKNCYGLTSLSQGAGLVEIDEEAFFRCSMLVTMQWGENLSYVGRLAFAGCNMRDVVLPDSVFYLGEYAFEGCGRLRSIRLSKGLTKLDKTVFADCPALRQVEFGTISNWYRTETPYDYIEGRNGTAVQVKEPSTNAQAIREERYYWFKR